ncbi:hypothetical protein LTS18_008074 [Coniosporium uncinatum]|uniref:Uncharacterized protein n=1 Tax=Coniosporium uncinatum TaxID=93489 RepID=A0ACC3DXG1_9PEZI|nr:hypothetical protein LTS18_008074 [Coniosporium uncinatum]
MKQSQKENIDPEASRAEPLSKAFTGPSPKEDSPGVLKRLASFTNSLNLNPKALTRRRQTSTNTSTDTDGDYLSARSKTRTPGSRQVSNTSSTLTAPLVAPASAPFDNYSIMEEEPEMPPFPRNTRLPRSQTTSFLPLPSKSTKSSGYARLSSAQSSSNLFRNRISTPVPSDVETVVKNKEEMEPMPDTSASSKVFPPKQPAYAVRSRTQPNLVTAGIGNAFASPPKTSLRKSPFGFSRSATNLMDEKRGLLSSADEHAPTRDVVASSYGSTTHPWDILASESTAFQGGVLISSSSSYLYSQYENQDDCASPEKETMRPITPSANHYMKTKSEQSKSPKTAGSCSSRPGTPSTIKKPLPSSAKSRPSLPRLSSGHEQIKQVALMQPISPTVPTSPPRLSTGYPINPDALPHTPLGSKRLEELKRKSINNSGPIRETSESSPCSERSARSTSSAAPKSPLPNPQLVHLPQPISYWAGRYMSARDVVLNKVFSSPLFPPPDDYYDASSPSSSSSADDDISSIIITSSSSRYGEASAPTSAPPPPAKSRDELEARKIFTKLYGHCTTEESRNSLKQFQSLFSLANRLPALQGFVPSGAEKALPSCYSNPPRRGDFGEVEVVGEGMVAENGGNGGSGVGAGGGGGGGGGGRSGTGKRRPSFMERLLGGRGRKSSGKSSEDGAAAQLPQYRIE